VVSLAIELAKETHKSYPKTNNLNIFNHASVQKLREFPASSHLMIRISTPADHPGVA